MRSPARASRAARLIVLAAALAVAVPAQAFAHGGHGASKPSYVTSKPAYVATTGAIPGTTFAPLVNSGETAFGTMFEGLPDGIGVVPGSRHSGYIDLYVTHENSPVPFGGFADYSNSSVSRVRLDLKTKKIIDMDVALSPDEGFIRFCSAFMAGPEQGFPHYTFLVNEESNDPLGVPAGATYGSDPSAVALYGAGTRQAGYSAFLDTRTGKVGTLEAQGRMNHENNVIVPGGWRNKIVGLSGDDTFTFPSTPERPNLSQFYMSVSRNWSAFEKDQSSLLAFRVTATQDGRVDPADPMNGANDLLDIAPGDVFKGQFIKVPAAVARGTTDKLPQDALEDWSNDNNVFQFVRVEDIAYDPDHPRTVYFTDTGNTKLADGGNGRLYRGASGAATNGRVFKMVLNRWDPTKVDSFSILAQADDPTDVGTYVPFIHPDNIAIGHRSLMIQEDNDGAKVWMYSFGSKTWTHVATATQPKSETSGIIDVSKWLGRGWWALDVQTHGDLTDFVSYTENVTYTGPGPANGVVHTAKREDGQLLLMYVPGS